MPFQAPVIAGKPLRERMLLMGGPGAGKTKAYMDIADKLQRSGSTAQMYVIDTDYAVERMFQVGYAHLTNIHYEEVDEYPHYLEAVRKFQPLIKPGDWLVCDLLNYGWEESQSEYVRKAYGKELQDHFTERKQAAVKSNSSKQSDEGFGGSSDWQIIKPMYQDFTNRFFYRHRGHVIACTGLKPLSREGQWKDSDDIISTFGHIGFKPEGEKRTAHHPHTVLHMKLSGTGEYQYSTAKDRERPKRYEVSLGTEEAPGSFANSYLMAVAGWRDTP